MNSQPNVVTKEISKLLLVNFRKRMQERSFLGEYITLCLELSAPEFNAFLIHVEQHIRALKPFYNTESFFKE